VLNFFLMLAAIRTVLFLYARLSRSSISEVNGPPKSDWLLGNLTDFHFEDVADLQILWQKLYGSVFKIHGLFGDEYLMISDPKAVKHVHNNVDDFPNHGTLREIIRTITGPGILVVDGDIHRRQRRIMQPAFAIPNLRNLFPTFIRHSQNLSLLLKKDVESQSDGGSVKIDMYSYLSKVTLDIIGDGISTLIRHNWPMTLMLVH